LQRVRGPRADEAETVVVEVMPRLVRQLQDALLTTTTGESVAYLTDFLLGDVQPGFLQPSTTASRGVEG
jgi:hypothetical protein